MKFSVTRVPMFRAKMIRLLVIGFAGANLAAAATGKDVAALLLAGRRRLLTALHAAML